jgi:peptide/nickel transport system substrate-binding protein
MTTKDGQHAPGVVFCVDPAGTETAMIWDRTRPTRRDVVAALAATPLALAASPAWPQAIRKGGSLIVAIQDNPPHLLTGISVDILTICVCGQIYDTLIKMDSKLQLAPSLAKSWEASADGLTYTFP